MAVRSYIIILMLGILSAACTYRVDKLPDLNDDIRPSAEMISKVSYQEVMNTVFLPKCISCHGDKGGVNLETYGSARQFLDKIRQSAIEQRTMPKAPTPSLTRNELLVLAAWIEAGGPEMPKGGGPAPVPVELEPTYESIKKLVIDVKCMTCHSPGGKAKNIPFATKSDLIDSPLEIVVPGSAEESMFVIVLKDGARKPMPPPDSEMTPLTPEQIQIIEEWINNGAKD